MSDDAFWLDGNALAGMLYEMMGAEMTTARHDCRSCGTRSALGAHRAYQGAGVVLRCPDCGDLAMCVGVLADRHTVYFTGAWSLDVPRAQEGPGGLAGRY